MLEHIMHWQHDGLRSEEWGVTSSISSFILACRSVPKSNPLSMLPRDVTAHQALCSWVFSSLPFDMTRHSGSLPFLARWRQQRLGRFSRRLFCFNIPVQRYESSSLRPCLKRVNVEIYLNGVRDVWREVWLSTPFIGCALADNEAFHRLQQHPMCVLPCIGIDKYW